MSQIAVLGADPDPRRGVPGRRSVCRILGVQAAFLEERRFPCFVIRTFGEAVNLEDEGFLGDSHGFSH
jgi:hypothetical protein